MLQAQIHEATLNPSQTVSEWDIASRMLQSTFKVTDYLWCIVTPVVVHRHTGEVVDLSDETLMDRVYRLIAQD